LGGKNPKKMMKEIIGTGTLELGSTVVEK